MTLRKLAEAKLFTDDTFIYIERHEGCHYYTNELSHKITFGNCLRTFVNMVLDQEINFLEPTLGAVIIHFKEEY